MALESLKQGWRDGSVGKSTDCSSRSPEFNSQQLTTMRNEIGCPLLVCLKTATVYLHIINKYIFKKRQTVEWRTVSRVQTLSTLCLWCFAVVLGRQLTFQLDKVQSSKTFWSPPKHLPVAGNLFQHLFSPV